MNDCVENAVIIQDTNPVVQVSSPSDGVVVVTPTSHVVVVECNNEVVVVQDSSTLVRITEEASVPISEEQVSVLVNEDPIAVVAVCEQGPAGPSERVQVNSTLAASASGTLDFVSTSVDQGVDWIVIATDTSTGTAVMARVNIAAVHRASAVSHTVYGRMGDRLFSVDVELASGEMRLTATNNHTESLDFNVLRLAMLIA